MDQPDPSLAQTATSWRSRSSRSRTTTAGGSRSSIAQARRRIVIAALRDGPGARLEAGRRRDLVHGRRGRLQPRRPRRDAFREDASGRPRAGHQHDPRHLEGGARADDQRERATRDPRAWAGRRQGSGALLARLLPRHRHPSDGSKILITESGEGAVRATPRTCAGFDGTPAVRLGDGSTEAFSPDGAWAISVTLTANRPRSVLLPTSVGEPRALSHEGSIRSTPTSFPTASRLVFTAAEAGREPGFTCATRRAASESPAVSPEGYSLFRGTSPRTESRRRERPGSARSTCIRWPGRRADGASGPRSEPSARAIHGRTGSTSTCRKTRRSRCGSSLRHGDRQVELWKELWSPMRRVSLA